MSSWICYIQENHQFFDIAIKFVALCGAIISAGIALRSYKISARKTKYEFFRDLHEDFLGDKILATRTEVTSFWQKRFLKISDGTGLQKVPMLSSLGDEKIKDYLLTFFGVEFKDIDEEFMERNAEIIKKTEQILNKYEHLAKLVEAKVIHKSEIKNFFYTMFADTFVVCLPFILYRRKSKPAYAHKMQALLKTFPALSRTWFRV